MVGDLLRNQAEVAIGPLTVSAAREQVVDFSAPFMPAEIAILVKEANTRFQSPGLFSFLQQNKRSGGSLSEDTVREEVRTLFRLREEERHGRLGSRARAKHARARISSSPATTINTTSRRREEEVGRRCDDNEAQDFSQLLPSQPLSPGELSQVERIITLEEGLVQLSQDLQDLDDIDFPRLEEEQIICDVPLTFRRDELFIKLDNIFP